MRKVHNRCPQCGAVEKEIKVKGTYTPEDLKKNSEKYKKITDRLVVSVKKNYNIIEEQNKRRGI